MQSPSLEQSRDSTAFPIWLQSDPNPQTRPQAARGQTSPKAEATTSPPASEGTVPASVPAERSIRSGPKYTFTVCTGAGSGGGKQRDHGPASHHVQQYLGRPVAGLLLCGRQRRVSEVVTAESSQRLPGPGLGTRTARSNQGAPSQLHPRPSSPVLRRGRFLSTVRGTPRTRVVDRCAGVPCRAPPASERPLVLGSRNRAERSSVLGWARTPGDPPTAQTADV